MTDNDRIVCQVLEQQLSLRLREGCRDVLLHLLPAPLRGLLYIALRSSAAGYARLWGAPARWTAAGNCPKRRRACDRKGTFEVGQSDGGGKQRRPALPEN